MVDDLGGSFATKLLGTYVDRGQLWRGQPCKQGVVEGYDGQILRDGQLIFQTDALQGDG